MADPLWHERSAALLAKAIGEFSFEGLLTPEPTGERAHRLVLPNAVYRFTAERTAFAGWRVDAGSITRAARGILGDDVAAPTSDIARFLIDAATTIGMSPTTTAHYLSELTATLTADVAMARTALPASELAELTHAELEGHLTGHPWLVASKGRVGFSAEDLSRYAPEAREPLRLPWLAVQRGLAEFRATPELSEHAVRHRELDEPTRQRFAARLIDRGLDPDTYVWLPTHPWQLDHVIRTSWAGELANDRIVELGESTDRYLPSQSIRTMINIGPGPATSISESRYQVKLPLRVLNTAVWRGLPPHCTLAAPLVTQWLRGVWSRDEILRGADLLGEVASVTVRHPRLSGVDGVPYTWLETLGCLWREPVRLAPGERAWALAAVLHVDPTGRALISEYIGEADPRRWLSTLVGVLLRPLLHLLYAYGVTVNPHGENVLIVTDAEGRPIRAVFKDLVDDVNITTEPIAARGPEPDSFAEVLPRKPWRILRQYLIDALLVGVFRPLSLILRDQHGLPANLLWTLVRTEVESYRNDHPELADRMAAGDLLSPTFARYPLNGDRLVSTGYAELPHRHAITANGEVPNPLCHSPR